MFSFNIGLQDEIWVDEPLTEEDNLPGNLTPGKAPTHAKSEMPDRTPKKFVKVNGKKKRNPEYEKGKGLNPVANTNQTFPPMTNMDLEKGLPFREENKPEPEQQPPEYLYNNSVPKRPAHRQGNYHSMLGDTTILNPPQSQTTTVPSTVVRDCSQAESSMSLESYTLNSGSSTSDPLEAYRKLKVSQGLPAGMIRHEDAANFLATHYSFPLSDYSNPGQHFNRGHNRKEMMPLNPQMAAVSSQNSRSEPYDSSVEISSWAGKAAAEMGATESIFVPKKTHQAQQTDEAATEKVATNSAFAPKKTHKPEPTTGQATPNFCDALGPVKNSLHGDYEPGPSRSLQFTQVEGSNVVLLDLPEDVFSMIYLSPWCSTAFWYALSVFFLQISILILALENMFHDSPGEEDNNNYNIPAIATPGLIIAQFIALFVAVLSQDDVTNSLLFMSIGLRKHFQEYQLVLQQKYDGAATTSQYWLANFLRFSEGSYALFVSFVFILQSETVIDIFLNFAAIAFVSELDNLGYRLANEGWMGHSLQVLARRMAGETLPTRTKFGCIDYFNRILLLSLIAVLFTCNAVVAYRQQNGWYIKTFSCSALDVQMGDEGVLSYLSQAVFKTEEVNGTMHMAGSTRVISFDPEEPPNMHYAYFSGTYKPDFQNKAGIDNPRPVYYEASKSPFTSDLPHDDTSLGFFYYCAAEKAWVWSIRALIDAGAVPQPTLGHCKYGWLLRSPPTDAINLEEAPTVGWRYWTGSKEVRTHMAFLCLECNTDFDCGLDQGTCGEDNVCHCHYGSTSNFCNQETACPHIVSIHNESQIPVTLYHTQDQLIMYGRQTYISTDSDYYKMIFYSGSRWFSYVGPHSEMDEWMQDFDKDHSDGHGYWFSANLQGSYVYSEATINYLPTGPMHWFEVDESFSRGTYGVFGRVIPASPFYKKECLSVNCDRGTNVCGRYGECQRAQMLTFENQPVAVGGKCVCHEDHYGHFCEFKLEPESSVAPPASLAANQSNEEL